MRRKLQKKVKLDLEALPAYMSAMEAIAEDAIEIHPGTPNIYYETNCIKGEETAPIMERAPYVAEIDAYSSRQPHLHIEPDCGLAYIDDEGRLTVHSKSIGIHLHSAMITAGIGIEPEKSVLCRIRQAEPSAINSALQWKRCSVFACLALDGRPCSLVYDQYQNITYTGKRSPAFMHIKMAADENGKLLAMEGDNYIDHGPYS